MSVLACDRKDCERIMCDFYSDVYGYLCYECKSELDALAANGKINSVEEFMNSPKPKHPVGVNLVDHITETFKVR